MGGFASLGSSPTGPVRRTSRAFVVGVPSVRRGRRWTRGPEVPWWRPDARRCGERPSADQGGEAVGQGLAADRGHLPDRPLGRVPGAGVREPRASVGGGAEPLPVPGRGRRVAGPRPGDRAGGGRGAGTGRAGATGTGRPCRRGRGRGGGEACPAAPEGTRGRDGRTATENPEGPEAARGLERFGLPPA